MFERNSQAEEIFSEAWEEVLAGHSIEEIIAEHPGHAPELESVLRLNVAARSLPQPNLSPQALARIEDRAQKAARTVQALNPVVPPGRLTSEQSTRGKTRPSRPGWLQALFQEPRALISLALGAAVLLFVALTSVVLTRTEPQTRPVVSYSGVIKELKPTEWLVGDAQVFIDSTTEIHGHPAVGATITCIAVLWAPEDRMRALEVWVGSGPGTPPALPTLSPAESFSMNAVHSPPRSSY